MPVGPSQGARGHDAVAFHVFTSITWIVFLLSLLTKTCPLPSAAAPSGAVSSSSTVATMSIELSDCPIQLPDYQITRLPDAMAFDRQKRWRTIRSPSGLITRHFEIRHRLRHEKPHRSSCQPARPRFRHRHPCAVGGDAGICVHLSIEFRHEDEEQLAAPGDPVRP